MPAPFAQVTLEEFAELLARFPFARRINSVHMHHTWRPNHSQYRGHDTIVSMWRYHTQTNGWRDIAQHLSIGPGGELWLGRNWNLPPVSASGHNGSAAAGPFMVEIIGDFDLGMDPFTGSQRKAVLQVICLVQRQFGLAPETLMFHNMMSSKTCPGTSVDYAAFLDEVRAEHQRGARAVARGRGAARRELPFGAEMEAAAGNVSRALELLAREPPASRGESGESELNYDIEPEVAPAERGGFGAGGALTPAVLDALRPHVVNLRVGRFSTDGLMTCSPADVDAIFDGHLESALASAKAQGGRLRVVFFAHGGLVSESAGLRIAYKHLDWWKKNGIYPINFVWETGLWETLGDLIRKTKAQGERSVLSGFITDPIIEAGLRVLPAEDVWSGMKYAAEKSSAADGGALYTANKLKTFCERHGADVELHAVGHSAGSIFHAHFLAACRALDVPSFARAQFMAPAVRVDTFLEKCGPLLGTGKGIDHVDLFTMRKDYERADNCGVLYRKSLLYLVSASAETEVGTPLLGLEESLRASAECRDIFGLRGRPSDVGEVVWSTSLEDDGRSASRSTTHGGFDDDPATLGSVARRVLGKADADRIEPYVPAAGSRMAGMGDAIDWPEALRAVRSRPTTQRIWIPAPAGGATAELRAPAGRRLALCIGIDEYRIRPLAGCVADARMWAEALGQLGFESPRLLINGAATRSAIVGAMQDIIGGARSGDVVVIQFAGHGTQLPDLDGDEAGGDTPGLDEALCPFDFPDGAFVIDDDIAAICDGIPEGVNVTFFTDCCHSGSVTRLAIGPTGAAAGGDSRPRFIAATAEMKEAHARFRAAMAATRVAPASRTVQREVLFSACRSDEVAWENNGHGDFTVRATGLLRQEAVALTNEAFHSRVVQAFGPQARQHPELHCAPDAAGRLFLTGVGSAGAASTPAQPSGTKLLADLKALIDGYGGSAPEAQG